MLHNQINSNAVDPVILARRIIPDDANPTGNVHGGHILQLMEEAGHVAATKHCNTQNNISDNTGNTAYMARLEHMDFLQPVFVNEIVQAKAEIIYVSQHSLAVEVEVTADNVYTGARRLTNRGILWYVYFNNINDQLTICEVPPLPYNHPKQQLGRQLYEKQKKERQVNKEIATNINNYDIARQTVGSAEAGQEDEGTVAASESVLAHLVMPSDCYEIKYATGGCLMKLMDTAAAMSGIRHCKTVAVMASINDIDFYKPVKLGSLITITSRISFISTKSMETHVRVIAKDIRTGSQYIASNAYFYIVSVDNNCMSLKVPPLVLITDDEKRIFEEGRQRYENRKKAQMSKMN